MSLAPYDHEGNAVTQAAYDVLVSNCEHLRRENEYLRACIRKWTEQVRSIEQSLNCRGFINLKPGDHHG